MFDLDLLERELTQAELCDMRRLRRRGVLGDDPREFAPGWVAVGGGLAATTGVLLLRLALKDKLGDLFWLELPVYIPLALLVGFAAGWIGLVRSRRRQRSQLNLAAFALANSMDFIRATPGRIHAGTLFLRGRDPVQRDRVLGRDEFFSEAGTLVVVEGQGTESSTQTHQYAVFRLPAPVPHLVLDNRRAHSLGDRTVASDYSRCQRLRLGELLDQRWRVLVPEGFGADAYQLITPDVMDVLLRDDWTCDIELVDAEVYCYWWAKDMTSPEFWREICGIRDEFVQRLARHDYRDRRPRGAGRAEQDIAPGPQQSGASVSPAGRRLRRRFPLGRSERRS